MMDTLKQSVIDVRGNDGGYVHAVGPMLVDGSGRIWQPRGVGLGNWLLPEGYMWHFWENCTSPTQIDRLIRKCAGDEYAVRFWREYRTRYVTREDIRLIARYGFNHVRIPINAKVLQDSNGSWNEDGFRLIDTVLNWCREEGILALLDLHGAPGGQTGTNIDDSSNNRPELFENDHYRNLTVAVWKELAVRYRDNTTVMGYDLLNEPLPYQWADQYSDRLTTLYKQLINVIREVDQNHLIMLEGARWATDWSIFDTRWDDNMCLQFHKYWSPATKESLRPYLDKRDELQVPIYMGEGGENTPNWDYAAFGLYEEHGIGWNLWAFKKMDTRNSIMSTHMPEKWGKIVAATEGSEPPAVTESQRIFDAYLDTLSNPSINNGIIDAVLGRLTEIPAWGCVSQFSPVDGEHDPDIVYVEEKTEEPLPDDVYGYDQGKTLQQSDSLALKTHSGDILKYWYEGDIHAIRAIDVNGNEIPLQTAIGRNHVIARVSEDAILRKLLID